MTTTPKDPKDPNSSQKAGTTEFTNGLGQKIQDYEFENDFVPGEPKLSKEGKTAFEAKTDQIRERATKLRP